MGYCALRENMFDWNEASRTSERIGRGIMMILGAFRSLVIQTEFQEWYFFDSEKYATAAIVVMAMKGGPNVPENTTGFEIIVLASVFWIVPWYCRSHCLKCFKLSKVLVCCKFIAKSLIYALLSDRTRKTFYLLQGMSIRLAWSARIFVRLMTSMGDIWNTYQALNSPRNLIEFSFTTSTNGSCDLS